jgi:hypothetical protein
MNPALIRSAALSLLQMLSLAACTTAPMPRYHLAPEPSPGAMIARAQAVPAALRTNLQVERTGPAATEGGDRASL